LIKKAYWLTERGPVIRRYDTTPDGEIGSGFGLGCSGVIHVLLERLTPGGPTILDIIRDARAERRPAVIAHLIHPAAFAGQRIAIDTLGTVSHNICDAALASSVERKSRIALSEGASRAMWVNNEVEVFIEMVTPRVRLLVFGAGDDAVPVTELAKYLGWQVLVFDGRAHYARREKFPQADAVVVHTAGKAAAIPEIDAIAQIDKWTAAVLMSHSYAQDLETLGELAGTHLSYLGVLGPRKRTAQLISDAGLDPSLLGPTLHSPMGLDIGADGPEQVALAVVAEIQARLNGRAGGLLRERIGSIHSTGDGSADPESSWLEPSCA
jgi:xanthine dehydrogenase accessory factor